MNSNVTGVPTTNGGIEINRGSSLNTSIIWSETDKYWEFTNDGTTYKKIADTAYANAAYTQANTGTTLAQAAFDSGNTTFTYATSAYGKANTSGTVAQAAYDSANTKFSSSGGTLSGSLTGATNIGTATITFTNGARTSNTFATSSTAQVSVDAFATATYRSAKYQVQMTAGTTYHMIELLVIHDGTTVSLAQYGEVLTGASLGSFDASITGGVLNLLFTATNSVTTVKLIRDAINI